MTVSGDVPSPAIVGRKPVLITGGAGFIGSNLADRLAAAGEDVLVYDALSRPGVEDNLRWLERRHPRRVTSVVADVRDRASLSAAASQAQAVFHLAAQVAVTTSLIDPREDFEANVGATLTLLEALRMRGDVPLVFASTNKVYGDLADLALEETNEVYRPVDRDIAAQGISESRPLQFHTPYGCSKGAADQYVLDYARSFGLPTCVLRMSCIYGPRQRGTEDQGWVAHFLIRALARETITLFGDGRQVRDVLHVSDAVDAYISAWSRMGSVKGRAFNLGGGPDNAVSLRQLVAAIETILGEPVRVDLGEWRPGDQRWFVSDSRQAREALGLRPAIPWRAGVRSLAEWLKGEGNPAGAPAMVREAAWAAS